MTMTNGYERALDGIEAEVRPEIEAKYADEWNEAGLVKRWFLLRRIEREIAECVAVEAQRIAPYSLY